MKFKSFTIATKNNLPSQISIVSFLVIIFPCTWINCNVQLEKDIIYGVRGSTIKLSCRASTSEFVHWKFKPVTVNSNEEWTIVALGRSTSTTTSEGSKSSDDKYNVTIDSTGNEYNLTIYNLQTDDAGTYRCIEYYEFGGQKNHTNKASHEYAAEVVIMDGNLNCSQCISGAYVNQTSYEIENYYEMDIVCSFTCIGNIYPTFLWSIVIEKTDVGQITYNPESETTVNRPGVKITAESKVQINSTTAGEGSYIRCSLVGADEKLISLVDASDKNHSLVSIVWTSRKPVWNSVFVDTFITSFSQSQTQKVDLPFFILGVTIADNNIYVLQANQSYIVVFNQHTLVTQPNISVPDMEGPRGLAGCSKWKVLYISDAKLQFIHRVDLVGQRGIDNSTKGWQLKFPTLGDLSITEENNLLVTISDKLSRVLEYSTNGQLMRDIELDRSIDEARQTVQMSAERFITCHGGRSSSVHRLCLINSEGQIIKSYGGSSGSGEGQLHEPYAVAIDNTSDVIFVADYCNTRVLMFDLNLTLLGVVNPYSVPSTVPWRICFDSAYSQLIIGGNLGTLLTISPSELA